MKRSKEGCSVNSWPKKPRSTAYYTFPPLQAIPGSKRCQSAEVDPNYTRDGAMKYIKRVKDTFQDNRQKYEDFLDVMKAFSTKRITSDEIIRRIKEIFFGHPDLIFGLNVFLPPEHRISVFDILGMGGRVGFDDAIDFVTKVKERYQDNEQVYESFLGVLNEFRHDGMPIKDVYDKVALLFRGQNDLLLKFAYFLPNTTDIVPVHLFREDLPGSNSCEEDSCITSAAASA